MASDVVHHLNQEPVTAAAPTFGYQFSKYVRRHRVALAIARAFLVLLVVGSVVSTWQAIRANRNAREQVRQRHLAETARGQVSQALNRMTLQRAEALFAARDSATAVAMLSRLLRDNPTNAVAAERLLAALSYRNFALPATDWLRHDGGVNSPQFSPDGRYLATSCSDNTWIWDTDTGQLVRKIEGGRSFLASIEFTPDGQGLLTDSAGRIASDNTVRVRDVRTGSVLRDFGIPGNRFIGHGSAVTDSAWSRSVEARLPWSGTPLGGRP